MNTYRRLFPLVFGSWLVLFQPSWGLVSTSNLFVSMKQMMAAEKYRESLSVAQKLETYSLSPSENYELRLSMGTCQFNLWNLSAAESNYLAASALTNSLKNPSRVAEDLGFRLGEMYFVSKKFSEARMCFQWLKDLTNSPRRGDYLYYFAKTCFETGDVASGRQALQTLFLLTPPYPKVQQAKSLLNATLP